MSVLQSAAQVARTITRTMVKGYLYEALTLVVSLLPLLGSKKCNFLQLLATQVVVSTGCPFQRGNY